MIHEPSIETVAFLCLFLAIYLAVLAKNAVRNDIDLYDMALLSTVAVVPAAFALFPALASQLSRLVGIEFPFLLIFGFLFLVIFVHLYRLVIKLNQLSVMAKVLVQEIGLLRNEVREIREARTVDPAK